MKKYFLFLFISLLLIKTSHSQSSCNCTITLCAQTWMIHNLESSNYRNGDPIPQVTDAATWSTLTTGAWCWYNNDSATYSKYGKLYNWYALDDPRGLAPWTWRIPSFADWNNLIFCLDPGANTCSACSQSATAGGMMKETGTTNWVSPNGGATNSSGFTALPAGSRSMDGTFANTGTNAGFWSTVWTGTNTALSWRLINATGGISNLSGDKKVGRSIRCVKN